MRRIYTSTGYPFGPDALCRSDDDTVWVEHRKQQIIAAGEEKRYVDQLGQWYMKSSATESPDVPDNAYYNGAQTDSAIEKLRQLRDRGRPFFPSMLRRSTGTFTIAPRSRCRRGG